MNLLLDQKLVSGLGNIYVNEILFQAKINPFKKSYLINLEENKRIVKYSKIILKKAIDFAYDRILKFHSKQKVKEQLQCSRACILESGCLWRAIN